MSNGDNPVAGRRVAREKHELEGWINHDNVEHYKTVGGLTKLEHCAIEMAKALVMASGPSSSYLDPFVLEMLSKTAYAMAEALINKEDP